MNCPNCQTPALDSSLKFCKVCGVALPEQAADPMIGQVVGGKYTVIKLLGEGGMGCVYKGEQSLGTKNRNVAIKTLHTQFSHDAKIQARFERECGTMAGLEHPNTIQVYDFGRLPDGQLYIAMEFVKGASLADTLEKGGPMEPARVEGIMRQVCGSLEEAHQAGIVHRDLKPDNIVLCERAGQKDFVKVLDFGIAKQSGEQDKQEQKLTQAGMVLGTPPYMSPEQFTGRPIDARSDIYSLGVMAYEMLTGTLPFKADTAFEWATQHMTVAPTPLEVTAIGMRAPEKMRNAIMRSLAKRVEDRFESVHDFFEAFAVGGVVSQQQPGTAAMPQGGGPRYSFQQDPVSGRAATQATDAITAPPGFGTGQNPSYGPPPGQQGYATGPRPAMPSGGGTAMLQPGMQQGTQPGMPPSMQQGMQNMGAPPGYGTPAGGNVAYPTPAPQPGTQPQSGGGSGKFIVIGILACVLVGGLVTGGVMLMRGRSEAATNTPIVVPTTPPTTVKTQDPNNNPTTPLDTGIDAGAAAAHDAGVARPTTTPEKNPTTTTTQPPATSAPHVYVPACGQAEAAKRSGHMAEYNRLAAICRAAGGVAN